MEPEPPSYLGSNIKKRAGKGSDVDNIGSCYLNARLLCLQTGGLRFVDLLDGVSRIEPEMRVRFTSPHPKDFPIEVKNYFVFVDEPFRCVINLLIFLCSK